MNREWVSIVKSMKMIYIIKNWVMNNTLINLK